MVGQEARWSGGWARATALCCVLSLLVGCGDGRLRTETGGFELSATALDFGAALEGDRVAQTLEVRNLGRARTTVSFAAASPFSTPEGLELAGGEVRTLELFFDAGGARATGTLTATDGVRTEDVALSGEGVTPLDCAPTSPCRVARFDLPTRACVETARPDGDSCVPTSLCLEDGVCVSGACLGQPRACDDENACTQDACAESVGCVHTPRVCPPSARTCHVAVCEPDEGCVEVPAQNLTPCGALSCEQASLCMAGACQAFAPAPDGMPCGIETPCREGATCRAGVCDIPEPTALVPTWSLPLTGTPVGPLRGLAPNVYVQTCEAVGGCALESFTGISTGGFSRWRSPLGEDPAGLLGLDAAGVCTAQGPALVTVDPATGAQGVVVALDADAVLPPGTYALIASEPGQRIALAADGARQVLAYGSPLPIDPDDVDGGESPDGGVMVLHTFEPDGGLRTHLTLASEEDAGTVALGAEETTWIYEQGGTLRRVRRDDAGVPQVETYTHDAGWPMLAVAGERVIAGGRNLIDAEGALVAELALPDAGVPLVETVPPWVLLDRQAAYVLARPCVDDGAVPCTERPSLAAYAANDGTPLWALPLAEDGAPRSPVEAALLGTTLLPVTGVGVLFAEEEVGAPAAWVRFYAEGAQVEACRISGNPRVLAGLFQDAALYTVVERNGAHWLEAYALDPFTARKTGWPQRDGISATRREH